MNFGKRLEKIRRERDIDVVTFSQIMEVSISTQYNYESGRRLPTFEYIRKLREKFNIDLNSFFTE